MIGRVGRKWRHRLYGAGVGLLFVALLAFLLPSRSGLMQDRLDEVRGVLAERIGALLAIRAAYDQPGSPFAAEGNVAGNAVERGRVAVLALGDLPSMSLSELASPDRRLSDHEIWVQRTRVCEDRRKKTFMPDPMQGNLARHFCRAAQLAALGPDDAGYLSADYDSAAINAVLEADWILILDNVVFEWPLRGENGIVPGYFGAEAALFAPGETRARKTFMLEATNDDAALEGREDLAKNLARVADRMLDRALGIEPDDVPLFPPERLEAARARDADRGRAN